MKKNAIHKVRWTKIFYKGDDKPNVGDFLNEIINFHGNSDVFDLGLVEEEYGINVDKNKLVKYYRY